MSYPTENTAEAAYIIHSHKERLGTLPVVKFQDSEPIIMEIEGNRDVISDAVLDWPDSPEFRYFAQLNWINLNTKRIRGINGRKSRV
jgi:hypothetical protein